MIGWLISEKTGSSYLWKCVLIYDSLRYTTTSDCKHKGNPLYSSRNVILSKGEHYFGLIKSNISRFETKNRFLSSIFCKSETHNYQEEMNLWWQIRRVTLSLGPKSSLFAIYKTLSLEMQIFTLSPFVILVFNLGSETKHFSFSLHAHIFNSEMRSNEIWTYQTKTTASTFNRKYTDSYLTT